MSKYTTGEIAKLCGVSVRTVQYYDSRKILIPSKLSEGGRRLYSQEDLNQLKMICFLREIGISIQNISDLLEQEHPENVISILLEEQEKDLKDEMKERQEKLDKISDIHKFLKDMKNPSLKTINDIAHIMENKKQLKKVRSIMFVTAIVMGIFQWSSFLYGIFQKIWWPFLMYLLVMIPYLIWIFMYYWNHISYICPECHNIFKPSKKEMFFAKHTLITRNLTCTCCKHKGFCVETYEREDAKHE